MTSASLHAVVTSRTSRFRIVWRGNGSKTVPVSTTTLFLPLSPSPVPHPLLHPPLPCCPIVVSTPSPSPSHCSFTAPHFPYTPFHSHPPSPSSIRSVSSFTFPFCLPPPPQTPPPALFLPSILEPNGARKKSRCSQCSGVETV